VTSVPARQGAVVATLVLDQRRRVAVGTSLLLLIVAILVVVSIGTGAVQISATGVIDTLRGALLGEHGVRESREGLIILNIRLPRTLMGLMVGAALAMSGALMQGLFRNPLADPGIVGVSAGAGLAAATIIVVGDRLFGQMIGSSYTLLPIAAFIGALASTSILYGIATRRGRTSVATMLLAGIALGALSGAATGFLSFISDDRQLRDLTFWALGSLGGATWSKVAALACGMAILVPASAFLARGLNALTLGEAEAFHLGLAVQTVKIAAIVVVAVAVGTSVATSGAIGFVGIVVPHMLRLMIGPDNRLLLPLCGLAGGALLLAADIVARIVVAPAELPIGIITALIGAPYFLWLLLREEQHLS
jgi:iron complex transport system permease protein